MLKLDYTCLNLCRCQACIVVLKFYKLLQMIHISGNISLAVTHVTEESPINDFSCVWQSDISNTPMINR